jgi:hypothetical protein
MLTLIHRIWRIDEKQRTVPARINICVTDHHKNQNTHKNHVCVVGNDQFLDTNSVVVTLVTVMHRETTCPANSESMKRLVHKLFHLAQELLVKAAGEE